MTTFSKYAEVILDAGIHKRLEYGIPEEMLNEVTKGSHIEVPLRNRMSKGYVYNIKPEAEFKKVKPISKLLSSNPLITKDLFELALWIAKYYCTPLHQVLRTMIPSSIRKGTAPKEQFFVTRAKSRRELTQACIKKRNTNPAQSLILDIMLKINKGILLTELLERSKISRSPIDTLVKEKLLDVKKIQLDRCPLQSVEYFPTQPKILNSEQAIAFEKILYSIKQKQFAPFLLHGITGSGKTEIYLQTIEACLERQEGIIMLVPEIALTEQTIERFRGRFGNQIAILHHRLSDGERFDEWNQLYTGKKNIAIGARSAIFSPVKNLGLIIIDEEHEKSYKQTDSMPCYHARDLAVMRAHLTKSTVLLGSATPSLESYYNVKKGKYHLLELKTRAATSVQSQVSTIDMKDAYEKGCSLFSFQLFNAIQKRKALGEQVLILLNRRGYHTTLTCYACKKTAECPHCAISLTHHKKNSKLCCHLCGYWTLLPNNCPSCHQKDTLKFSGTGTEKIETVLKARLPDLRILRMDADTTKHKGSHQQLLRAFRSGKADLLIGTQMIAKGLHFPQVSLVGVLNSDSGLNIPDFRSSEYTFQLITQVAGRAGRAEIPGEVMIQALDPKKPTIIKASKQDYNAFYEEEIAVRKAFHYPPYTHMVKFLFSGKEEVKTKNYGEGIRDSLIQALPDCYQIHPLLPCGYAKIKDSFRFQFLIRGQSIYHLNQILEPLLQKLPSQKQVKMLIDIDPASTFF